MASDNGDMEIQEDSLDAAIKTHRRAGPPDGLLDRCLSTITAAPVNRVVELTPVVPVETEPVTKHRALSSPFYRWVIAASILFVIGGAYFIYDRYRGVNSEVAFMNIASKMPSSDVSGDQFGDYRMVNGAIPELVAGDRQTANGPASPSTRIKDVRDGLANTVEFGEVATVERSNGSGGELPVATHFSKTTDQSQSARTRKENEFKESLSSVSESAVPFDKAQDRPNSAPTNADSKERQRTLGKGKLVSGRGLPQNLDGLNINGNRTTELPQGLQKNLVQSEQAPPTPILSKIPYSTGGFGGGRSDEARDGQPLRSFGSVLVPGFNTEAYSQITDNPFLPVSKCPLSTFSTDVDTASYANVRRFLSQGQMPPRDAVRIEELINYFSYDYAQPKAADPFSVNLEVAGCPWNGEHRLVRIGLKGREIADQQRPPANLVFLVDVSGSMQPANKLPLLKTAMKMLVGRLGENERVAIVTYSHEIRLVLPSTTCDSKETIYQALDSLQAAGSTNGGGGIQMAYSVAVENFIQGGTNRVILATDGDFNVGITDPAELTRFIEQKRESGVFLSVLGFGMGNLKDATLERLADKGNGHYAYIDTIDEARKVLVDQLSGTLVTIAKDVKLQIEFNPRTVSAYRLIGYENRVMPAQDFNDDRKDAGDIGAGHTVTALYEIVPAGKSAGLPGTDPLKYQPGPEDKPVDEDRRRPDDGLVPGDVRRELLTVKLRYKKPNENQSLLAEVAVTDSGRRYGEASSDFKFASAVAAFGMILRDSPYRGSTTFDAVLEFGEDGRSADREGYRSEFLKLVRQAKAIRGQ